MQDTNIEFPTLPKQCTFSGQGSYCAGVLELALLVLIYSFVFLSGCWSVDLTKQPHQEDGPGMLVPPEDSG